MSKNKWTAGSGRWKSTPDKNAQVREPPRPAVQETVTPRSMTLLERLPTLSDSELLALQANAQRVSADAANKKAAEAAELLPPIAEELARRAVTKTEAGVERKKMLAANRVKAQAKKAATAAAEAAAAAEVGDSGE